MATKRVTDNYLENLAIREAKEAKAREEEKARKSRTEALMGEFGKIKVEND